MDFDTADSFGTPRVVLQFCLMDDCLMQDAELLTCINNLGAGYFVFCQEALHASSRKRTDKRIVFVAAHFEGKRFKRTKTITSQIIGRPALFDFYASRDAGGFSCRETEIIPTLKRPLYNRVMGKVVAVVDGFCEIQNAQIIKKIHNMGGFVMKKLTSSSIARHRPTHLIAFSALCRSYHVAVDNDITIATEDWVAELWSRRDQKNLHAADLQARYGCLRNIAVCLVGFQPAEQQRWSTLIESAGGKVHYDLGPSSNIVVLNDACEAFRCRLLQHRDGRKIFRLKFEREAVHLDVEDDQSVVGREFLARSLTDNVCASIQRFLVVRDADSSPYSSGRKRQLFSDSAAEDVVPSPKRRAGATDMPLTETASRQLKTLALTSPAPQRQFQRAVHHHPKLSECDENEPAAFPVVCQRRQRAMELLHTERNYVRSLRSLLENVVGPLEAESHHEKSGFITIPDLDIIFGNLPTICRIHEKIVSELNSAIDPWNDTCEVGAIYAKFADELSRVYPLYVSSYDDSRRFIQENMKHKPKLLAFITRCMSLPEFGRQSLFDILIRPVQRLPTILLLLKDLQKHTDDSNPDYSGLARAVASVDSILSLVNRGTDITNEQMRGSTSQLFPRVSGPMSFLLGSQLLSGSPKPTRNDNGKRHSVDGGVPPDSTSLKAWEKARKLAYRTSSRVSKAFTFGAKASGSGLKRAASTLLVNPAKNPKNLPEPEEKGF